ncbi:MAG: ABC transporter ATP-binding protein [Anaerolineae bacterium]|nr:ABC transporter ATP-binding protein [Anaerolineae bacterium]
MAVIEFENVRKAYRIGRGRGSLRDAIPQMFGRVIGRGHDDANLLWALDGVSFEVGAGETLGLIGPNGAGKTTILKLLSRVTRPTSGHIAVKGRLSALIELGAGFHPDLTGRENIYLNGAILGLKKQEIDRKFEQIVDFAELGDFIDTPVKRYSSGMYVRLGFAVAAHVDPDVLLIDEVLAVGDYMFKDKCVQRINEFREAGKTMVIVSHNKEMIQKLCTRTIFLNEGQVVYQGDTQKALDLYHTGYAGGTLRTGKQLGERGNAIREMQITKVVLLDGKGQERNSFLTAEPMVVQIHFRANASVDDPVFYSRIREGYRVLHGTTTARFDIKGHFEAGDEGVAEVRYESLNLLNGEYNINVGIKRDHFSPLTFDQIDAAVSFTVGSRFDQGGALVYLPHHWQVHRVSQE